jgi:flotillin
MDYLYLVGIIAGVFIFGFMFFVSRYKRCPSDKILVIYGSVGGTRSEGNMSSKCIHGGAAFIWPVFQDFAFLDLTPIPIEVNLTGALSKQNIRVDVPCRFTVGIATEPAVMTNAAERLLGLQMPQIKELAIDIILGQLRLVIATMDIEEINTDRDKFLHNIANNVDGEIRKIGLKLINVNVTDIKDESGYIESLGKEAAVKAINDAKITVAERNRDGAIGQKQAEQEQRTKVAELDSQAQIGEAEADQRKRSKVALAEAEAKSAEAEAETNQRVRISKAKAQAQIAEAEADQARRIKMADANALAIDGENKAKMKIADSEAERRERAAEAERKAIAAEKIKQAEALEAAYKSQEKAELARADKEKATQLADVIVKAEIEKQKMEIDAEAIAEQTRRQAKGQADAIFSKMEAEGRGIYEIMGKQAEGFDKFVQAAGGDPQKAVMLMIADKLPEIVKTQVEAIKNLKIDKITVWEGGGNSNGNTATANFVSGMFKSLPPLNDLFKMAGMELPTYLKGAENIENITQDMTEAQVVEDKPKKENK